MGLFSNPEFLRNARSQLRTGKLLAAAAICAAISLALGFSFSQEHSPAAGPNGWGFTLLKVTIFLQALVLAAGGGIACLNSIYKEKEQNTFDFQRVTRLTPPELALGKLFGPPVFAYFVFLCLMPLALFAAAMGRPRFSFVVAAYAVLIVASISFHALALLISLFTIRGSHTSAILLFLVLLWSSAASGSNLGFFRLGPLGPFLAAYVAAETSWHPVFTSYEPYYPEAQGMVDSFFGRPIHHVPVLLILDAILALWFLLAVVRNIKRDPNYYEMFSPVQSLGFALFLNAVFLAFFRWHAASPIDCQAYLLTLNMVVFFCLGLAVLRNRERVRRILRTREELGLLDITWPSHFLILGTAVAGLLVVAGVSLGREPQGEWDTSLAVLRSLFFVAWLVRDIQYLQWMSLRRGKHPLVMGVLFQLIFYVCVIVFLTSFSFFRDSTRTPFTAFFVPSPVYLLDHAAWISRPAIWGAAFVAQWLLTALFISLQRQVIAQMNPRTPAPAAAEVPA